MNRKMIFLISLFLYAQSVFSAAKPISKTAITLAEVKEYEILQNQLSSLLKQWHPIAVEREKYSITPFGIIIRLLAGDVMAGPALTANYLNQYLNPGKFKETINKATLALAAMSAAPAIYGILEKTGGSVYDAFTYPNIELIEEQNKKVVADILKINKQLTIIEQNNPTLDYQAQKEAYDDIKFLFKQPQTWFETLTFKNTQKEHLDTFFTKYKNYNSEKLQLLLERNKAHLINEIETPQKPYYSPLLKPSTLNPAQAIVGGITMLPTMLLEAFTAANEEAKRKLSLNQEIALIDTILAALATYP